MALKYTMNGFLEGFRYRSESDYYDVYKIGDDFRWYKWGDKIRNYGFFFCYFILFVTSTLATFGRAIEVNILAWRLVGAAARGFGSLGRSMKNRDYFKAWGIYDKEKSSSDFAAAKAVLAATDRDFDRDQLMDLGMKLVQFFAEESLTFEQWNFYTEEERGIEIATWEENVKKLSSCVEDGSIICPWPC